MLPGKKSQVWYCKLFLPIFQKVIDMSSNLPITQKINEEVEGCVHKLKKIANNAKYLISQVVFIMMSINWENNSDDCLGKVANVE